MENYVPFCVLVWEKFSFRSIQNSQNANIVRDEMEKNV